MRMWMCPADILCMRHILGEHGELHKFRHNFVKGHSIEGRRGQIEPASMRIRHDALVYEMLKRGMKHNSPYEQPDLSHYDLTGHVVDKDAALEDLLHRCPDCRQRYKERLVS
jgi:hypothetical protein